MKYTSTAKLPEKPFNKIALTLSGGGYRAAAFSLGTLCYLNRLSCYGKSLLSHVTTISTVSGGTIVGAYYACCIKENKSFDEFYHGLYRFMDKEDLIKKALDKLLDNDQWRRYKSRNLINAFALVYDECLFEGKTFDLFFNEQPQIHLEDIIVNATEFKNGLEFRFFKSYNDKAVVGNHKIDPKISRKAFREIKIADALAASSCFPAGFEPIAFPDDFLYKGTVHLNNLIVKDIRQKINEYDLQLSKTNEEQTRQFLYDRKEQVADSHNPACGLMDGGIVDNQGIGSVLRVEENRSKEKHYHDLLFISDVASYFITDFQFVSQEPNWIKRFVTLNYHRFTLRGIDIGAFVLLILTIMLMVLKVGTLPTVFLTILGLYSVIRILVFSTYRKSVPPFFRKHINRFRGLSLEILGHFMKERISSVLLMVTEVFMKRIRSLHLKIIYDKDYTDYWRYRAISNFIYTFKKQPRGDIDGLNELKDTKWMKRKELKDLLKINESAPLIKVATEASAMSTTLWFSDEDHLQDRLNSLIACGQFTTCYNLIKYIYDLRASKGYEQLDDSVKIEIDELMQNALQDWEKFVHDPKFLIHDTTPFLRKSKSKKKEKVLA